MSNNRELRERIKELEAQESEGMEATLSQMLSKEQAEKWGLDEHGHKRNVQHIFMRACLAISELEDKVERLTGRGIEDMKDTINTLEGTLENTQDDNVAKEGRIVTLEAEAVIARKCNSCMSRQLDKLTDEPLSCNGNEDGKCDEDIRNKEQSNE